MKPKTTRVCPVGGCSRPELHRGKCGMITPSELKKALPGSTGSLDDRKLWHSINS